jgi:hypothetical protein
MRGTWRVDLPRQEKRCSPEQKREFSPIFRHEASGLGLFQKFLRKIGSLGQDSPGTAWGWNPSYGFCFKKRRRGSVAETAPYITSLSQSV